MTALSLLPHSLESLMAKLAELQLEGESGLDFQAAARSRDLTTDWEVWTPDGTGACIGSGSTREEAIEDAIKNLMATVVKLHKA